MILDKLIGFFSSDMSIDLGTANTLVLVKGKGIIINEPSVVAVQRNRYGKQSILAVGKEAEEMFGKTPIHISAIRPLENGVISDFEVTEKMIRYFLNKVKDSNFFNNILESTEAVVSAPINITDVERRAISDVCKPVGVRNVYLVDGPIAMAIGAYLPVSGSEGTLVVDIGGGSCEIAVISLSGVVVGKSLKIAGNKLNEDIIYYVRDKFKMLIGEKTAEEVKISIG